MEIHTNKDLANTPQKLVAAEDMGKRGRTEAWPFKL
jgi:hypothetical protein